MNQNYTSKNTSINSSKLPAIYGKVTFKSGKVLDYGCGKYIDHIKAKVESQGCKYYPYDPFNLPYDLQPMRYEYGVCSNVLNVIDEEHELMRIIMELGELCDTIYITVYEGDGSGKGKATKEDCYQRNDKLSYYLALIKECGYEPTSKKGVITYRGRW